MAIYSRDINSVRFLLENGADANQVGKFQGHDINPMTYIQSCHFIDVPEFRDQVINLLRQYGAR